MAINKQEARDIAKAKRKNMLYRRLSAEDQIKVLRLMRSKHEEDTKNDIQH